MITRGEFYKNETGFCANLNLMFISKIFFSKFISWFTQNNVEYINKSYRLNEMWLERFDGM